MIGIILDVIREKRKREFWTHLKTFHLPLIHLRFHHFSGHTSKPLPVLLSIFLRHASLQWTASNPLPLLRASSPLDGGTHSDIFLSRSAARLLPRCNWRAAVYLSDVTLLAPVYWMEGRQREALCDLPASRTLFERKRRPPRTGLVPYTTTACLGGSRTDPSEWNVSKFCLESTLSQRAARLRVSSLDCQIASHCSFNTLTAIPRLSVKHQTVLPFALRRTATSEYPNFRFSRIEFDRIFSQMFHFIYTRCHPTPDILWIVR